MISPSPLGVHLEAVRIFAKEVMIVSRSAAGFRFTCKACGVPHLLISNNMHDGIRVPCYIDEDKIETYEERDFVLWHGFVDMFSCIVYAKD